MKATSVFLKSLGFTGPSVLINETQARENIRAMTAKAKSAGAVFRPHFKTHQSAHVGRWFAEEGVTGITVSSVRMAEYFARHGWNDITIAFLLNPLQWPQIEKLTVLLDQSGGSLGITIDSPEAAESIARHPMLPLKVWIKIDTGYGRTGIPWDNLRTLHTIAEALQPHHSMVGLLTHAGNTYAAESLDEISTIWRQTRERLMGTAHQLGNSKLLTSVGDTPACRSVESLSGVSEIRPGNFVFFDLMQWSKGICETRELAAAAVAPVVGIYPGRNQMVVHGGAVHLSREFIVDPRGNSVFGYLGTLNINSDGTISQKVLTELPVISLSQEHSIIEIPENPASGINDLKLGDLVLIWPVHSCLTCDLSKQYVTTTGEVLSKF